MGTILMAAGFVLVFEGLVFALLPKRLDDLAAFLAGTSVEARRLLGLLALTLGVGLLWLARSIAG